MSEHVGNEIITAAERVLRELNEGREPYAPSVMPMARALAKLARDPQFILAAAEKLLREAGVARVLFLGPPHDTEPFVEVEVDATLGAVTDTLYEAYHGILAVKAAPDA